MLTKETREASKAGAGAGELGVKKISPPGRRDTA